MGAKDWRIGATLDAGQRDGGARDRRVLHVSEDG